MTTKVFVDGQEGTTGLKIFEYLSGRRDAEVLRIEETLRKDVEERRRLINESDVTFLCLPDVASRESVSLVDADNHRTDIETALARLRTSVQFAQHLKMVERLTSQRNPRDQRALLQQRPESCPSRRSRAGRSCLPRDKPCTMPHGPGIVDSGALLDEPTNHLSVKETAKATCRNK